MFGKKLSEMKKLLTAIVLVIALGLGVSNTWADCAGGYGGAGDQQKLIQDIRMCVQDVRNIDPRFTAYLNPSTCHIDCRSFDINASSAFRDCMGQAGWWNMLKK
jgi:hypothetical protein